MLALISGTRPIFIQLVPIIRELQRDSIKFIHISTKQHVDYNMSGVFCSSFQTDPDIVLEHRYDNRPDSFRSMLGQLIPIINSHKITSVLVDGDCDTTWVGAIAAHLSNKPIIHVESGLRSNDLSMPEETIRRCVDHMSDLLFCPTKVACNNLGRECVNGITELVGDTVLDFYMSVKGIIPMHSDITGEYCVLTLHRPSNVDNPDVLNSFLGLIDDMTQIPVVFPVHPRTRQHISTTKLRHVELLPPMGYLEFQSLIGNCKYVFTDSGTVQRESGFHGKPCIILRNNTEWVELVDIGSAIIAGSIRSIISHASVFKNMIATLGTEVHDVMSLYGDGHASRKIVDELIERGYT